MPAGRWPVPGAPAGGAPAGAGIILGSGSFTSETIFSSFPVCDTVQVIDSIAILWPSFELALSSVQVPAKFAFP